MTDLYKTYYNLFAEAFNYGYMGAPKGGQTAVNNAAAVQRGYAKTREEREALEQARKDIVAKIAEMKKAR